MRTRTTPTPMPTSGRGKEVRKSARTACATGKWDMEHLRAERGALRPRWEGTGVPFQIVRVTRPDTPARLADGLGLESTRTLISRVFAPWAAARPGGSPAPGRLRP